MSLLLVVSTASADADDDSIRCTVQPVVPPAAQPVNIDRAVFWQKLAEVIKKRDVFVLDGKPYYLRRDFSEGTRRAGTDAIIDKWESVGGGDSRQLAYLLGTVYRETVSRMQPVREAFCDDTPCVVSRLGDYMAKHPGRVKKNYAIPDDQGRSFYGRGLAQLSLKQNYKCVGHNLGWGDDLLRNPDLALEPDRALTILVEGARRGLFKYPHRLDLYFNDTKEEWISARRVVNPGSMDHARITEHYARLFYKALGPATLARSADSASTTTRPVPAVSVPPPGRPLATAPTDLQPPAVAGIQTGDARMKERRSVISPVLGAVLGAVVAGTALAETPPAAPVTAAAPSATAAAQQAEAAAGAAAAAADKAEEEADKAEKEAEKAAVFASSKGKLAGDKARFRANAGPFKKRYGTGTDKEYCATAGSVARISKEVDTDVYLRFTQIGSVDNDLDTPSTKALEDCKGDDLVATGIAYKIPRADFESMEISLRGFEYGGLIVPFKYYLGGEKSIKSSATIAPYVGYHWPIFWGLTFTPIAAAGVGMVPVEGASGETENKTALSTAIGMVITSAKSEEYKAGIVFGKDFLSKTDRANDETVGKVWFSLYLGVSI
ncbi:glycoside hydrolase family 19 protein [Solimonas sp. K1W22B-7]|uniref:glycoside hydrolase family 19 protein n=1 Tax=Solimonas sp. K1W22B-7 TaxID=2303331 RepID=UPI0013C49B2A|nr:glycoside hydrolase family 19 protein [Solimonas sp. K1W22B-7]